MDIKDLGKDDGIIVNTQEEWNKLLKLGNVNLDEGHFSYFQNTIMYPTDNTHSDHDYAIQKGNKLYNVSDFLSVEPNYEIY